CEDYDQSGGSRTVATVARNNAAGGIPVAANSPAPNGVLNESSNGFRTRPAQMRVVSFSSARARWRPPSAGDSCALESMEGSEKSYNQRVIGPATLRGRADRQRNVRC